MFLESRRKTIVSSEFFLLNIFYVFIIIFDSTRYSRHKLRIGVHAAVKKMFGHSTLDGEIWYLS